jgi:hypothetical protein
VIIFRDVPHSVPRIELLHGQKFLGDPILLSSPDVVQSNLSLNAFAHFMEILSGAGSRFSPETSDDVMLLVRGFGYNILITPSIPQRDCARREGNVHELLKGLDRSLVGITIAGEAF